MHEHDIHMEHILHDTQCQFGYIIYQYVCLLTLSHIVLTNQFLYNLTYTSCNEKVPLRINCPATFPPQKTKSGKIETEVTYNM